MGACVYSSLNGKNEVIMKSSDIWYVMRLF